MNISKFFIDRPVLANVLAIVIVLIGGVAAFSLPIAQYPNIVPPTVSVTTTYPGASAATIVNQVALPVELQVNGVEGMIYMQSTSTDTGTYTLTVTFEIGTDLDFAQVLVQNRVSAALASLPAVGPGAGPDGAEEVDLDARDRVAVLARRPLRQPVSQQLRHHQPGQRAGARAGRRQRHGAGRRHLFDAHLARPDEALHLRPLAQRRDQRRAVAEPVGDGGPGRHAAGRQGPELPVHGRHPGPARRAGAVRQHRRQGRERQRRPHRAAEGRGEGRARRPDLRHGLQGRRQAGRRPGHLPDARGERARRRRRGREEDGGAEARLPARPRLQRRRSTPPPSSAPRSTRCS